jgi:hypothetical protein
MPSSLLRKTIGNFIILSSLLLTCLGQAPPNATLLQLSDPEALCLDGSAAFVYVSISPQPSDLWVLNFGSSPTLDFCIDVKSCIAAYEYMSTQSPPSYFLLSGWGIQSRNCIDNPDFCNANHILFPLGAFSPGCDLGLMVSRYDLPVNETFSLHFRGPQIINAALSALIDEGNGPMANARNVLLTGVTFGGTAAVLAADIVQTELSRVLPSLEHFSVIPVDAIHPRYYSMVWMAWGNFFSDSWMTNAFQFLANVTAGPNNQPASPALQSCIANNNDNNTLWECLYLNASLPHVTSPLFLVQQLSAVWDNQCGYEGAAPTDNLMQVECSKSSSTYEHYYTCVQYPDLCSPFIVANFSVPLQHEYSSYANTSIFQNPNGSRNGYFLHSCYLGVYSMSGRGNTSVWNIITVGGFTLREAISAWWNNSTSIATNPSSSSSSSSLVEGAPMLYHDCYWNPSGVPPEDSYVATNDTLGAPIVPPWTSRFFCNPTCKGFPWY